MGINGIAIKAQSRFEWALNALRLVLFRMVIRCYTHGGIDFRARKSRFCRRWDGCLEVYFAVLDG